MSKKFTRNIEDFICVNCGMAVHGDGYTNHCPNCLYSMDLDINPGDRASGCGGLMEPTNIKIGRDGYIIVHCCQRCGKLRENRSAPDDNFETMLEIMRKKSP